MRPGAFRGRRRALVVAAAALFGCSCGPGAGGTVYVTSGFEDRIYVLDAADGSIRDTVDIDRRLGEIDEPHGVVVAPDGEHWYATLSHGDPTLWKFELGSNRLVGRLTLPQPGASRIGVDPAGRIGLVPDYFRSGNGDPTRVSLVDLDRLEILATSTPCTAPHDAVFAPGGGRVAVTCAGSDEVVLLDATTMDVRARFPAGGTGARPMNLVWSADGRSLFVTLMGENRVVRISADSGREEGSAATGAAPAQIARTADGSILATANRGDASVSILDAERLTEVARAPMPGEHPHGVAFDGRGERLFVTYEGTTDASGGVVAMDRSGAVLWHVPLGIFTLGVAWSVTPAR